MVDLSQTAAGSREPRPPRTSHIPMMSAASLLPTTRFLDGIGVNSERWLEQAHIPVQQLYRPGGVVTLHSSYRFLEAVAIREGIEDLGAVVAAQSSAFSLGQFGEFLQQSATVLDYIRTGARLVSTLENQGITIWLTNERDHLRINQATVGGEGLGAAITDSHTLVMTVSTLRHMIGPNWCPGEIRLRVGTDAALGEWVNSASERIVTGQAHTSLTVPHSVLLTPVVAQASRADSNSIAKRGRPSFTFPDSFRGSVETLVDGLAQDGRVSIGSAAEAAGMSSRGLQRRLTAEGTSFTAILATSRMSRAKAWLAESEMSVVDVAAELGYTDSSNFARAFHRETGLSPTEYRRGSERVRATP